VLSASTLPCMKHAEEWAVKTGGEESRGKGFRGGARVQHVVEKRCTRQEKTPLCARRRGWGRSWAACIHDLACQHLVAYCTAYITREHVLYIYKEETV